MLNEKQRKLFSEILDLNWDCTRETNMTKKFNLIKNLGEKKEALKADMGAVAYDKFMSMGQKMFS